MRLPGSGGLWIAESNGSLIRRLAREDATYAAWSPDGKYVACSYGTSEIALERIVETALITRDGNVLSRRKDTSDLIGVFRTGLGWARPDVLWQRYSGHASSFITFWKIPATFDLNHVESLGQVWGDDCALSPDSTTIACTDSYHVSTVVAGSDLKADHKSIYPPSILDAAHEQASVDVNLGQVVGTGTEPNFRVQVSLDPNAPGTQDRFSVKVTPPDGNERGFYVSEGGALGVDLDDAHWAFALRSLDPRHRRFRITVYKDDSKRKLLGVAWSPDGSRLLTWEETRQGSGPLTLERTGGSWFPERFPVPLPPSEILTISFDAAGKATIVESPDTVYRCVLDSHPVCPPIAKRLPIHLDVRRGENTVPAGVLDWRCPAGRN